MRVVGTFLTMLVLPASLLATDEPVSIEDTLQAAASEHCYQLTYQDGRFGGAAWERLLTQGQGAHFFLIGEEHGVAENARLASQLFAALAPAGYQRLVIEVSPAMASIMDERLRSGGLDGLRELFAQPGGEPAFFGMHEEAELLATARAAIAGSGKILWGVDYEVASDRILIERLRSKPKPRQARRLLAQLAQASAASWTRYYEEKNPQYIYSFAGDPELVAELRAVWSGQDAETRSILETLEQTFRINQLWVAGKNWQSNHLRAQHLRSNFLAHWHAAKQADTPPPRIMLKLGASHLVRGRNTNETFDLGTLIPELAATEARSVFSLLVIPGAASETARLDPVEWKYHPAPAKDGYSAGLNPLLSAAGETGFRLIDLRALRPLLHSRAAKQVHPRLAQMVHGYDALLILNGATASRELTHP